MEPETEIKQPVGILRTTRKDRPQPLSLDKNKRLVEKHREAMSSGQHQQEVDIRDEIPPTAAAPYGPPSSRVYAVPPSHRQQTMQQWQPVRAGPPTHMPQQQKPHPHHPHSAHHQYTSPHPEDPMVYKLYQQKVYEGFHSKNIFGCAVWLLILGSIFVLSGSIMAFYISTTPDSFGGYGLWGGAYYIAVGLMALFTHKRSNTATVTITFVLGIVAVLLSITLFVLSIIMCLSFFMAILDVFVSFSLCVTSVVLTVKCADCSSD